MMKSWKLTLLCELGFILLHTGEWCQISRSHVRFCSAAIAGGTISNIMLFLLFFPLCESRPRGHCIYWEERKVLLSQSRFRVELTLLVVSLPSLLDFAILAFCNFTITHRTANSIIKIITLVRKQPKMMSEAHAVTSVETREWACLVVHVTRIFMTG